MRTYPKMTEVPRPAPGGFFETLFYIQAIISLGNLLETNWKDWISTINKIVIMYLVNCNAYKL